MPIISSNTQAREEGYFRLEWKLAVDRSHLMADNKAFFFPVILGDVVEVVALVPDRFRERQWSRLNDDSSIKAFVVQIAKLTSGSASPGKSTLNTAPILATTEESVVTVNHTPSIAVLAFATAAPAPTTNIFPMASPMNS